MKFSLGFILCGAAFAAAPAPTFHKDVLPLLQSRCQVCHRAGEIGPMELITYKQVRPWAKSIKETVSTGKMPPWFADSKHGHFSNDRTLSKTEIDTLTSWVDSGAKEGDPKDAPAPREFTKGWAIPQPDVILQMPSAFSVPAKATIDYQYIVIPTNFTEDRWVRIVESRPSSPAVVHHAVIFVRPPKSKWLRGEATPGVPFVPPQTTADGKKRTNDIGGAGNEILTIYTPGNVPDDFGPTRAKLIPAGSDLVFQMHYTTNGKAAADQTSIGLIFAKEPPQEKVMTLNVGDSSFVIPPGNPNYPVIKKLEMPKEATLSASSPTCTSAGKPSKCVFSSQVNRNKSCSRSTNTISIGS